MLQGALLLVCTCPYQAFNIIHACGFMSLPCHVCMFAIGYAQSVHACRKVKFCAKGCPAASAAPVSCIHSGPHRLSSVTQSMMTVQYCPLFKYLRPVLACSADLQFLVAAGSTGVTKVAEGLHALGLPRLINAILQVGVTILHASNANALTLLQAFVL